MFDDILISEQTRRQLEVLAGSPPHAVLICGDEHVGKHLMARRLAASLLVSNPDELEKSSAFREIIADKGTIPIEAIRMILPFLSLIMPGKQTVKRVVLVPDAELMTHAAQNALLKVLEEPPADTVIIMTTSHLDRLLPTIRSRCQLCRVKRTSNDDTREYLHTQYDTEAIKTALLIGNGSIGSVKLLLDTEDGDTTALQDAKAFLGKTLFEQLVSIDTLAKDRENAVRFVGLLMTIAEKSLLNRQSLQWQKILQATLIADEALRKNGNTKLILMELALSLR